MMKQKPNECNQVKKKKVNLLLIIKKTTRKANSNSEANKTIVITGVEKIMEVKENNSSNTSQKIRMPKNRNINLVRSL